MKASQAGHGDLNARKQKQEAQIQRRAYQAASKMQRLVNNGVRITSDLNTFATDPVLNALKKTVEKDGEIL